TREYPEFGPGFLKLGELISARAGELEENYPQRKRAQQALEEARRLMGDDPEVLVQYGLLLRRQQLKGDAERVLQRAWAAAESEAASISPAELAELHYTLALIYEAWWNDWKNLVMIPASAEVVSCSAIRQTPVLEGAGQNVSHWDAAVLCPERWAAQLQGLVELSDLKSSERRQMLDHFRLAFGADSSYTDAAFRLLGHLAEAGEWDEYTQVAGALIRLLPNESRTHLFYGLGLHEQGYEDQAEPYFVAAMELLPEGDRLVFNDISPLLGEAGRDVYYTVDSAGQAAVEHIFFTSADPLFLTSAEERRLEHYSRLAWAELQFGDPAMGRHGWDSERGEIWVRYGQPWRQYQCCYGGSITDTGRPIGGRHEYWGYGPRGPLFVFRRQLTYRHARMTEVAKFVADEMRISSPQIYRPNMITDVFDYPHQIARFRGSEPQFTSVEIYSGPPVALLGALPGTTIETGAFLFDQAYNELWSRRLSVPVAATPPGLSYNIEVPAGKYYYGLETRRELDVQEARAVARVRDSLVVAGFPEGQLNVSDVLLADAIRVLNERPSKRDDLRIWPNRSLHFRSGDPISVYFEVYGLEPDDQGLAQYRVDFAVEDAESRNLVQRIASGITTLFSRGGEQEPEVSWERVVAVVDDRSIEYLTVELPNLDEGSYAVRLRITDLVTGQQVYAERVFNVGAS
ncbi:MAG TPA: GWxTD domain-containing protein, partial [Gemmatimonadota bacterium]|nr:GWxTD domain-containing protein [Gemmatimonadota bacterium]